MANFQDKITRTTRLPQEPAPVFEFDDIVEVGLPSPSPLSLGPSSAEPASINSEDDIQTPQLKPIFGSITPGLDIVHPPKTCRQNDFLEAKPGFFRSDNTYLSHWDCCQCHKIHPILDKNKNFRDMRNPLFKRLRDSGVLRAEPCTNLVCIHARCDTCFDLDICGFRRQHCNGDPCIWKQNPHWPPGSLTSRPILPVTETVEVEGAVAAASVSKPAKLMPVKKQTKAWRDQHETGLVGNFSMD